MDKHAKEIFAGYEDLLRKFRKNDYISNMERFTNKWQDVFKETIASDNREEIATNFVNEIEAIYKRFGRVSKTRKIDLNLFMVYFVFPLMQNIEAEGAEEMCDILVDTWNDKFGTSIEYMTYDEILGSFKDKMFGMF